MDRFSCLWTQVVGVSWCEMEIYSVCNVMRVCALRNYNNLQCFLWLRKKSWSRMDNLFTHMFVYGYFPPLYSLVTNIIQAQCLKVETYCIE